MRLGPVGPKHSRIRLNHSWVTSGQWEACIEALVTNQKPAFAACLCQSEWLSVVKCFILDLIGPSVPGRAPAQLFWPCIIQEERRERRGHNRKWYSHSTAHLIPGLAWPRALGVMQLLILSPWFGRNEGFFLRQHDKMLYKYRKDKGYEDDVHVHMRCRLLMTFGQMYNSRWYSKYKFYHPRIVQCQFLVFGILWKLPELNWTEL